MKIDETIIKRFNKLENFSRQVIEGQGYTIENEDVFYQWIISVENLLINALTESNIHYKQFHKTFMEKQGFYSDFERCKGIFLAAKDDFENGYIFNLHTLISSEISEDILEQAQELLNANYKDAACVIIGVALENSLKELCSNNNITPSSLNNMNNALKKNNVYNLSKNKQITAWADLRNNAAHGNFNEYTMEDVKEMLSGVRRFIAENL